MHIFEKKRPFLMVVLGCLCALLCAEFALHIVDSYDYNRFKQDKVTGLLSYRPDYRFYHAESCFENISEVNNLGFHGDDISFEKPDGVFRVVVLGNSFVEALQVANDTMFTAVLQKKLNAMANRTVRFEIVPIAFSGNGTYLNNMYYYRFGSPLKPDLVMVMLTGDELRKLETYQYQPTFDSEDNLILQLPEFARDPRTIFLKTVFRKSKLFMNTRKQIQNLEVNAKLLYAQRTSPESFTQMVATSTDVSSADIDRFWETEEKLLRALSNQVHNDDAQFLLAAKLNSDISATTTTLIEEKFKMFSKKNDVPLVFLNERFNELEKEENHEGTFTCDWHWNTYGHSYVAEGLFEYLTTHPQMLGEQNKNTL